jgi:hypothetical protein
LLGNRCKGKKKSAIVQLFSAKCMFNSANLLPQSIEVSGVSLKINFYFACIIQDLIVPLTFVEGNEKYQGTVSSLPAFAEGFVTKYVGGLPA